MRPKEQACARNVSQTTKSEKDSRPKRDLSLQSAVTFFAQKNREAGEVLLSREANRSTIGAGGLNFRVRHGTGWTPSAILTCFSALSKLVKRLARLRFPLLRTLSRTRASTHLYALQNKTYQKQVKASAY